MTELDCSQLVATVADQVEPAQVAMHDLAQLFAALSRFYSMSEDHESPVFAAFKDKLLQTVSQAASLKPLEVLALVTPFAAEDLNDEGLWDRFADSVLSNQGVLGAEQF